MIPPQGPAGPAGTTGPQGPAGISGQTRWGNVLVAPDSADVLLAQVGNFQFFGRCDSFGNAQTVKKTTTNGNSIYDEDTDLVSPFNVGNEVVGDEDYDEAGFARNNSTGLTIQYLDYSFNKGDADPNKCEFQGTVTQTS
jgi:hypothetical protein